MMKNKILIVDDDDSIRKTLADFLQLEGFVVTAVDNGETAIELLDESYFDIMLLDILMPGISGMDVMRHSIKTAPGVQIILLTGHGSLESAIEALRAGAHDFITKPFTFEEVLASIRKALARRDEQINRRKLLQQLGQSLQALRSAEGFYPQSAESAGTVQILEGIWFDFNRREISDGTQTVQLTPTEAKLIRTLLEFEGKLMTHRELVMMVQGYNSTDLEAADILRPLVSRVRRKLLAFPNGANWIVNVRGTGYLFDPNGTQAE